jgi:hypothetical protein
VKLTAGGQTYTQPLTVKMDPRVATPADSLRRQFDMEMKISEALRQDYDALQQVRKGRTQLKNLVGRVGAAADDINAVEKKLGELEGTPGGYGVRARSDTLAGLNSSLATVYAIVDSGDAAPTSQAIATFSELQKSLTALVEKWQQIKSGDIGALNQKLRSANLPPIDVSPEH